MGKAESPLLSGAKTGWFVRTSASSVLRTHVSRRAHELAERRENGFVGQRLLRCLGDSKVNHLGHRHPIVHVHQNVRRLDVAMNGPLLVRVLDGLADLREQAKTFHCGETALVAIVSDANALDQFHHKVRPARRGGPRIQNLRDVRMVHECQCLGVQPRSGR